MEGKEENGRVKKIIPSIPLRHLHVIFWNFSRPILTRLTCQYQLLVWHQTLNLGPECSAVPAWCSKKTPRFNTYPTDLCLSLFLSLSFLYVHSSKQTNLCVRKTVSSHTKRGRERTVNVQTTQTGTEGGFCLWGNESSVCLSLNTPLTPLSWSVVQQKNGSITSWSSPCQVTPRKWVLKLFFFSPSFVGVRWGSQTGLVFKVRKWKLCFLMSCLSGCLCVWWSVKCSVTLTKWLWLCSCGFKWPSPHCHCLYLHHARYEMGKQNGGHL